MQIAGQSRTLAEFLPVEAEAEQEHFGHHVTVRSCLDFTKRKEKVSVLCHMLRDKIALTRL